MQTRGDEQPSPKLKDPVHDGFEPNVVNSRERTFVSSLRSGLTHGERVRQLAKGGLSRVDDAVIAKRSPITSSKKERRAGIDCMNRLQFTPGTWCSHMYMRTTK